MVGGENIFPSFSLLFWLSREQSEEGGAREEEGTVGASLKELAAGPSETKRLSNLLFPSFFLSAPLCRLNSTLLRFLPSENTASVRGFSHALDVVKGESSQGEGKKKVASTRRDRYMSLNPRFSKPKPNNQLPSLWSISGFHYIFLPLLHLSSLDLRGRLCSFDISLSNQTR